MVLGSENGIHERLGEVLVTNQATLRAACAKEGRDGFGLKPVRFQRGHAVERRNRHEAIAFEFQPRWVFGHLTISEERLGARLDLQPLARHGETPDTSALLALGVAGPPQVSRDRVGSQRLSHMQLARGSQDYRRIAENVPIQAGINDSRELQVKVNKNTRDGRDRKQQQ
jgi:hypothetical protein